MRYVLAALLLAGFSSTQAIAGNETLAKLTAEGLCKEYGYRRASPEFDRCLVNVMRAAADKLVAHESIGQLFDAAGDVQIVAGGQAPQAIAKGAALGSDMVISTGENSQAVLKFLDGQVIALQPSSSFHIHDYRYNPNDIKQSNLFFSLLKGGMRSVNGLVGSKHPAAFRLETRHATLGVRSTDFMLVTGEQTYAQVSTGLLQIDNAAGTKVLIFGEAAVVVSENTLPASINGNELPPNLFLKLNLIPIPDANPIVLEPQPVSAAVPAPIAAPVAAVAEQEPKSSGNAVVSQEESASESSCEGFGYIKGSDKYSWCVETSMKAASYNFVKEKADDSVGQMYSATGDVEVATGDAKDASASQKKKSVGKGVPLKNNMYIYTGEKSQAVLKFKDGQVVAMQPNTAFRIKDYRYDPKDATKSNASFSLLQGGIRAVTGAIGHQRPEAFKLKTRLANLGVRGTDFMVVLDEQMFSQDSSGSISIGNQAGTVVLNAGQSAAVVSENTLPALMNANELPPEISSQFSEMSAIPVPPATPMESGGDQRSQDSADSADAALPVNAQGKKSEQSFCESYGYAKGSVEYKECLLTAGENGYAGDATKYQEAGQIVSQGNSQGAGRMKKQRQ